ncbi:MAG: hypothetical protein ACREIW_08740, partial [Chthoniobacterales bacterium]
FNLISRETADLETQLIGCTSHDIPRTIAFFLRLTLQLTDGTIQATLMLAAVPPFSYSRTTTPSSRAITARLDSL